MLIFVVDVMVNTETCYLWFHSHHFYYIYIYIIFFVRRFWFGSIDLEKERFITKWLNKFSNNIMFWLSVAKTHESKRHVLKPPLYNNSLSIGDKNFNATFKSELLGCLSTCWHLRTSDCAKLSVQPWNVMAKMIWYV